MMTATAMNYGYARVSTTGQDPQLQIDALHAAGCNEIYVEHASAARGAERPVWADLGTRLRPGDTITVWRIDRASRSLPDLAATVEDLTARNVRLVSLSEGIDTGTGAVATLIVHLLAAVAAWEREVIVARTRAGLEAARRLGRTGGRPTTIDTKKLIAARALVADGATVTEAAQTLGVGRSTLYRHLGASP
ncbi:MAG: recombinase family protein [Acidimicrobiales bacterium]|nr:recombinase family protein [Acidimicrobiales bacterium]